MPIVIAVGALVLLAVAAQAARAGSASTRGGAPMRAVVNARAAFELVRRQHPELLAAATAEMQRLGSLEFDREVGGALEYMGEGPRGVPARYGSPQVLARAIESLRARGYLMTAGLFQRVLERMVGRA